MRTYDLDAGLLRKLEPCYTSEGERAGFSISAEVHTLHYSAVCEQCQSRQAHRQDQGGCNQIQPERSLLQQQRLSQSQNSLCRRRQLSQHDA